jgi:hypothetical protein
VLVAVVLAVAVDAATDLRRFPKVDAAVAVTIWQLCIRAMFMCRAGLAG